MSEILTAKEFIESQDDSGIYVYIDEIAEMMIKFSGLHVQEALKSALEEVPYGGSDSISYEDVVHILDCYPLENIK